MTSNGVKQVILAGLVVVFSLIAWLLFRQFLVAASSQLFLFIFFILAVLCLIASVLLQLRYFIVVAVVVPFLAFVVIPAKLLPASLGGAAFFVLGMLFARGQARHELENSLKFSSYHLLRRVVWPIVTTLSIFTGMLYYDARDFTHARELPFSFGSPRTLRLINPVLRSITPRFHAGMNVDQFLLELILQTQKEPTRSSGFFGAFSDIARSFVGSVQLVTPNAEADMLQQLRSELGKELGFSLTGQENILDVASSLFNIRINEAVSPYRQYIPWVLLLLVVLTVYALSVPFRWIALFVAVGMIWMLRLLKFVRIETRQAIKEELVL